MTHLRSLGLWRLTRLALGILAVGVAVWVWLTRGDVLLADHPAYPVLVSIVGLLGLWLAIRTLTAASGRPLRSWQTTVGRAGLVVLVLLLVGMTAWLRPFSATGDATRLAGGTKTIAVESDPTTWTLSPRSGPTAVGLVFQPGARVDSRAYLPLLTRIAERGYLVVIVKQPLDVGLLATGAPGDAMARHPEVKRWVVGGHSLGGVAAGQYAAQSDPRIRGLLLWASYPLDSLAGSDLEVTSVSGSRDGFTTPADVEASRAKLPFGATFVAIDGAIHGFFGDYGDQPGDGTATVGRAAAQDQIVDASVALLDRVAAGPASVG